LKRNQCDSTGPAPFAKIFLFSPDPNHLFIPCCPVPSWRGVSRSSRTLGAGCGGRGGALTNVLACGRRSRVVLTPRRWRQVCEKQASCGRRWQTSPVTGESAKETVKTIARGMPGVFRCDRGDLLACFLLLHARLRAHRAPGIPCALCCRGRDVMGKTRAKPAARSRRCVLHLASLAGTA
jgi:hypothetical protein